MGPTRLPRDPPGPSPEYAVPIGKISPRFGGVLSVTKRKTPPGWSKPAGFDALTRLRGVSSLSVGMIAPSKQGCQFRTNTYLIWVVCDEN